MAVILVKRRTIKNTKDREFLDKLHNSMNNQRYSNKINQDLSKFISLEEVNYMLRLPSQVDLDSQYVSIIEASLKERAGLSNAERALKVYVYDSHTNYLPISGSPFSSLKAAAKTLLE